MKNKKRNLRLPAFILAGLLLLSLICPGFSRTVFAEENKRLEGYWELWDTKTYYVFNPTEWIDGEYINEPKDVSVTPGSVSASIRMTTGSVFSESLNDWVTLTDWASAEFTWTNPPERFDEYIIGATITPTPEEWNLHYKMNCHNLWYADHQGGTFDIGQYGYNGQSVYIYDSLLEAPSDFDFDSLNSDEAILDFFGEPGRWTDYLFMHDSPSHSYKSHQMEEARNSRSEYESEEGDISMHAPWFEEEEDLLQIYVINVRMANVFFHVAYIYKFHDLESAGAVEPVPAEDSTATPVEQTSLVEAESKAGEDEGSLIDQFIITGRKDDDSSTGKKVGLSVVGAAVAGAIALGGSKGGKDGGVDKKKKKKKTQYKMYMYKNFGDAIPKGSDAVRVYARIARIEDGKEYNAPELTEAIEVSGQGLEARSAGMRNSYLCAEISAGMDAGEKGSVTFRYTGEGGTYRKIVVFRLTGLPRIVFPGLSEDGRSWIMSKDLSTVQMVAGEGGFDKLRFVFADAAQEPESIRFLNTDGFEIEAEKDPKLAFTYYACIRNNTKAISKESGIFADPEDRSITIEATFGKDQLVQADFTIELYPQGLSVLISRGPNKLRSSTPGFRKVLKDGWMEVISYATRDKDKLTLDPVIPSTGFNPCLAMVAEDEKARIFMDPKYFTFQKFRDTGSNTKNILNKYHYKIGWSVNGYAVSPEESLPEMENPYYVLLPVSASADGRSENAEIPVRLLGEPFDPMKGWKEEFQGLCDTARRYFPENLAENYVAHFEENMSDPQIWDASALRMLRYDMIRAAQEYWTRRYEYHMWQIQYYNDTETYFKKPARYIGDLAFRIVARFYWGENESWITPCKDLIVDTVDDAIWSYHFTGTAEWNVTEHIMEQSTNTLENYIGVKDSVSFTIAPDEQKKLFFLIVAYTLADWVKNYYTMDPKDFWESWRKTWFDLTGMALKKIVGAGLSKAMNSQVVKKFFQTTWVKAVTDFIKKNMPAEAARGNAVIIDPKTGLAKTGPAKIVGNIGDDIRDNTKFVHFGESGKVLDAKDIGVQGTMLAGPGGSPDVQLVNFESLNTAGYWDIFQALLDDFFGKGIAWLTENANETVQDDASWRGLIIPLPIKASWLGLEGDYEDILVQLDVLKLLSSEEGLASRAFSLIYETLFESLVPGLGSAKASKDPAREVLKLTR